MKREKAIKFWKVENRVITTSTKQNSKPREGTLNNLTITADPKIAQELSEPGISGTGREMIMG